jgi:phosphomannomutase
MSFIDPGAIRPFHVVLDAGSGMGGLVAPRLFERLPCRTTRLCFEIDGRFPNHEANPLIEENRRDIVARVVAEKADIGIAWDGDADRCFFIDDTGAFVPGDFVTALLGEVFAHRQPGAAIVYDVRASRVVADRVGAAGGVPLMNRVGHAFIKKRMRDENGVFGGEVSGHYYFRDNWYADNGMIPALMMLELLGREAKPLSQVLAPLRARYHISGEINSRVADVDKALAKIEKRYGDAQLLKMDGLSVDYPDWHFNVRPSNTEPLLRLNLEADSPEAMEGRRDEVLALIRS